MVAALLALCGPLLRAAQFASRTTIVEVYATVTDVQGRTVNKPASQCGASAFR